LAQKHATQQQSLQGRQQTTSRKPPKP
jgi:hypothetical protein